MIEAPKKHPDVRQAGCAERLRLTGEFTKSLEELVKLQCQQAEAVIRHDPDFARFDILIHMASHRKREAKYALLKHQEGHGCQGGENA
jgi:hypothetical protein